MMLWCGLTSAVTGAPLSVKVMVRAAVMLCLLQRLAHLRAKRAIDGLRVQRHFHDADTDGVVDGVGQRRANAEGRNLAHALGAERAVRLVVLDVKIFHVRWQVVETRN